MNDLVETTLTPRVVFADEYAGFVPPQISVSGDLGADRFRHSAELIVPKLLYLLEHPGGEGAFTHLAVDVSSPFFAENHDWEYEVAIQLDEHPFDRRLFHKWYGRHQFLIPIPSFRGAAHRVTLSARATRSGASSNDHVSFAVALCLCSKPRIWKTLAESAIWIFSTARSGSTWLTMDLICADRSVRPVDESGVGRMFAPLQWDAERFFDPASLAYYVESGLAFDTGEAARSVSVLAPFQRHFTNLGLENQIFNRHNFHFYHRMLRDIALEHVLNEWGLLGFRRLVFKTPNDSHAADFIMRAFPESRMIFLIRDGRDVMRSRFSPFASEELAKTTNPNLRRYAVAFYSHFWNFQVDIIRSAFEAHPEARRTLIRYEDLRQQPLETVTALFERLGLPTGEEMVASLVERTRLENIPASERGPDKPRQTGRVGGYRDAFDADEVALMNAIMGPNLIRYGYAA
ncbi:MAG TPA: sulfotransferase [Caulobacteraceae bacterium]|nr:sulfotransferase [Caulobacteraceae bacterium]